MIFSFRLRLIGSFILLLSITILNLGAQALDVPLPFDNRIKTGALPNGLKYYIKPNPKPEKKVELRLAINAGSLLENDDQQGMAHFIEHMNFNGTEHYPKNALVDYLQSIGVQFGADLNAYTSFDETVYILPIPTSDPANVEKGFEVLSDWAQKALFTDKDINEERNVVLEESRGSKGADDRMMRQYLPKLMAGSHYANRLPIGKEEIIQNGSAEAIRAFHRDWYRPDLMAVAVAGDITAEQAEALINKYFASLTNPAEERVRPVFEVAPYGKKEALVLTDKEATIQQFMLVYSSKKKSPNVTLEDYRNSIVRSMFFVALNNRMAKLTESSNPPYLAAYMGVGGWARGSESLQLSIYGGEDLKAGVSAAIGEILKVKQFGFNQTEMDVIIRSMMSGMEKSYNERKNRESSSVVDEMVRNFLSQESIPGIEQEYQYYLDFLPTIALEEVNVIAKNWLSDNRPYFALAMGPESSPMAKITEKQLLKWVSSAFKQKVVVQKVKELPKSLLPKMPSPGKVIAQSSLAEFGATVYTLSNGLKVTVKKTDFKDDEILLTGRRFGGSSQYAQSDKVNSTFLMDIISQLGYGDFTPSELSDFLSGRYVGVTTGFTETHALVSGSSTVKDLETMLQLNYLKMTSPRKDPELFKGLIAFVQAQLQNVKSDPQTAFMDSVQRRYYNHHPLAPISIPSEKEMGLLNMDKAVAMYQKEFGYADGFSFVIVGNVHDDTLLPLMEKYLASLPVNGQVKKIEDNGLRPISGVNTLAFYNGSEPKSMIMEKYYGEMPYSYDLHMHLKLLVDVVNIRIVEELREKMGGIYSGGMNGIFDKEPYGMFSLSMFLPCGPERVDTLIGATHAMLERLKQEGPTAKDLEKVKRARIESNRESMKNNYYWLNKLSELSLYPESTAGILDFEARINAVTTEDLKAAANVLFSGENVFRAILYPEK